MSDAAAHKQVDSVFSQVWQNDTTSWASILALANALWLHVMLPIQHLSYAFMSRINLVPTSNFLMPLNFCAEGSPSDKKSAGMLLARKLSIFPSSSKVNPLGSPDEKLRSLGRKQPNVSASSEAKETVYETSAQAPWSDLPEVVVEKIFTILKAGQPQSECKRYQPSAEEAQVQAGHRNFTIMMPAVCLVFPRDF